MSLDRGGYTDESVTIRARQFAPASGPCRGCLPSVPSVTLHGPASAGVRGMERIRTGDGTCNPVAWPAGVTIPPLCPVPMVVSVSRSPAGPRWERSCEGTGRPWNHNRVPCGRWCRPRNLFEETGEFLAVATGYAGIDDSFMPAIHLAAGVIAAKKMSTGLGRNRPKSHRYPISVAFTSSPTKGRYCRKLSANMLTSLIACSS